MITDDTLHAILETILDILPQCLAIFISVMLIKKALHFVIHCITSEGITTNKKHNTEEYKEQKEIKNIKIKSLHKIGKIKCEYCDKWCKDELDICDNCGAILTRKE